LGAPATECAPGGGAYNYVRLQLGAPSAGAAYNWMRLQLGAPSAGADWNWVRLQLGAHTSWARMKLRAASDNGKQITFYF
jgi:hypothetical protein